MERTVRTQRSLVKQEESIDQPDVIVFEKSQSDQNGKPKILQIRSMDSTEEVNPNPHRPRNKSKLLRSQAVREEASPPREPNSQQGGGPVQADGEEGHEASLGPAQPHQHPQPGKQEGRWPKEWTAPPLSRGNSREMEGSSSVDLHQFIVDTLNRNHKDRILLLKIESELLSLDNDMKRTSHKFPPMSSYQRMLVHRVAAYFGMEHNVDPSGTSVIVNTTKTTRIPEMRFREYVRDDFLLPEEPRRSILKRDSSSFDETGSFKFGEKLGGGDSRRSKSFEEREEEYEKVRRRIFNREHSFDVEDQGVEDLNWKSEETVFTSADLPTQPIRAARLLKVESYDSGDSLRPKSLRPCVAKSHSFSGYEPQQQNHIQPNRVLTKQDSGSSMSSRISPLSSGYKSQRSDATLSATPSPTATPNLQSQLSGQSLGCELSPEPETVVWAVSDLSSVPSGSVLIHPQTGQPYTNPDGSIYRYDPNNPPRVTTEAVNGGFPVCPQQATQSPSKQGNCDRIIPKIESNNYGSQYIPNPEQYPQSMEAQQSHYHPAYHPPIVTQAQPYTTQQQAQDASNGNRDLSQYMLGLRIDGSRQQYYPPAQSESRPVFYWQPAVQGHTGGGTVYYAAAPPQPTNPYSPSGNHRYPSQAPPAPPQVQPPVANEHSNNCYNGGYPPVECISYNPSTVQMYLVPPYNSCQAGVTGSPNTQPSNGYNGNTPTAPVLAVPYAQQCPHPPSPHSHQGVCGQYVYNSCYPTHYSQPMATLPVPAQIFRKSTLQVGVRCSSPMRVQYPTSPTVKEGPSNDKIQPVQSAVYGFRVVPGEMRFFRNSGRPSFTLQAPPKISHPKKHR